MTPVLFGVLVYVAVQLLIGLCVSRRIATEEDYLLAGRRLGPALATFTIFATWFGAETCVGSAGAAYENGVSPTSAEPFAYGLCLVLMGLFFALPLWKAKLTTLADLFRERFSPGVETLAALMMIPTSVLWAAAQIHAFGDVLSASSELHATTATTIAAGVVVVYTVSGGLLADAVTDVVQGIALAIGLLVLFFAVTASAGFEEARASLEPGRARFALGAGQSWLGALEAWSIPICGSVFAQELVARVSASRSPRVARRASILGGLAYVLVGLVPLYLGLVGPALVPGLADSEQILPALAQRHLSTFLYVVFAGALVSAILSTVDSTLLVASSLFSHNVLLRARPRASEAAKVRAARLGVIGFGTLAYVLALHAEGVLDLVEQASAFGSSGILVIVLFGLFTREVGGAASAYGALLAGLATYLAGTYAGWPYPYLASLAAAALGYAAGLLAPRARSERTG